MENVPIEIERKYIIKLPKTEQLRRSEKYTVSEIEQIYLKSCEKVTHRIRKRTKDGKTAYTETKKVRIDKMSAFEDEREITDAEYMSLSENMKENTRPIKKTRYTFVYEGNLFEVDVYPAWKSTCILETELREREEQVIFPSFVEIIKEVTGEREYSNAKMAESFPCEIEI